ncbi:DUF6597 domain-containing transcriptional factor [Paenibacillaceae bacterium WGS1546]|uniref:DUF6597 domain-containing transcriptional factor n=1 Tax=Cohnella sp. WGS1546 TaxID=3366810 RepID=UPI00372D4986
MDAERGRRLIYETCVPRHPALRQYIELFWYIVQRGEEAKDANPKMIPDGSYHMVVNLGAPHVYEDGNGRRTNTASFTAYIRNDGVKQYFSEVRIYYRTTSGAWTDGGTITRSGDVYSYNFTGKVPSGTSVQWMFRIMRSGVSQAAFGPAKFYQPDNNPNASSYAYDYWTNTVS